MHKALIAYAGETLLILIFYLLPLTFCLITIKFQNNNVI